jgi:5,5'-dehydrodivanillate O-demethylase
VEERGIACAYHGWLYDTEGNCLETPAEPADSRFHLTVRQRAYPVRQRYGMYWAYLGPAPAPVLPRYDFAEMAPLSVGVSRQDCNWLQVVENNLDQSHTVILHQATRLRGARGLNTTRGLIDGLEGLEYTEAPFGIRRHRTDKNGYDDTDLMVFPGSARIYNHLSIKVPIDDTHTNTYTVMADLAPDTSSPQPNPDDSSRTVEYRQERITKSPPDAIHPLATYSLDGVKPQDLMVLETQGPIAQREIEHLATADRGVVLMRNLLRREIEKVQHGLEPIGLIRDPERDLIDTYIHIYLDMMRRFPNERSRAMARQA